MRVQQEHNLDEVQLCKDIKKRIEKLYDQLLEDDQYKCSLYSFDLTFLRIYKKIVELAGLLIVIVSCSLLIYLQIDQWINLDDNEKWINDTQIPWGLVYILLSIPIIVIQGADYNIQSQSEKEILLLASDYKYIKKLNEDIPDLEIDVENIHPYNLKYFLLLTLLMIQFFSDGYYQSISQLVALQYLSEMKNKALSSFSKFIFGLKLTYCESPQYYFKIWKIKIINYFENPVLNAFQGILKKQNKISNQLLREQGNQLKILLPQNIQNIYYKIKITTTASIIGFFTYSIQKSWYKDNFELQNSYELLPMVLMINLFYMADLNICQEIQQYMMNLQALKYLKNEQEAFYYEAEMTLDGNHKIISSMFVEKKNYQIFLVLLQMYCMTYSKPVEKYLNIFSLNFIENIDSIAINRLVYSFDKDTYLTICKQSWFQFPKQYSSFNQFYLYILGLRKKQQIMLSTELQDKEISQIIYKELAYQFYQLQYEDGFQIQFVEKNFAFMIRGLICLLEIFYIAIMIYDKQDKWFKLTREEIYIDDVLPYGVVYVIISSFIILLQGIGRSEDNKIFKLYLYQRKNYYNLQNGKITEWNDDAVSQILLFNNLQETVLILCLLAIQFFSQYFMRFYKIYLPLNFYFISMSMRQELISDIFIDLRNFKIDGKIFLKQHRYKNKNWKIYIDMGGEYMIYDHMILIILIKFSIVELLSKI